MKKGFSKSLLYSLLLGASVVFCIGCSKRYSELPAFSAIPIYDSFNNSVGRFKTSYLADQIHAYYRGSIDGPIGVATFVDLDNFYGTSSFGRYLSEQLMTELALRGYRIIELRKADVMQIMEHRGEFALSRDVEMLRDFQDLSAVVIGTYVSSSPQRVYLNVRLVEPKSAAVLSAGSVEMVKTEEISRMLRTNSLPPSMERIPVRHLGYSSHPLPYYYPWVNPHMQGQGFAPRYGGEQMYPHGGNHMGTDIPEGAHAVPEPMLEPTT